MVSRRAATRAQHIYAIMRVNSKLGYRVILVTKDPPHALLMTMTLRLNHTLTRRHVNWPHGNIDQLYPILFYLCCMDYKCLNFDMRNTACFGHCCPELSDYTRVRGQQEEFSDLRSVSECRARFQSLVLGFLTIAVSRIWLVQAFHSGPWNIWCIQTESICPEPYK
jgi:hypothetical protein